MCKKDILFVYRLKIADKIVIYTEEKHLANLPTETVRLYVNFKKAILELNSDLTILPHKYYISFKLAKNLIDVELQKHSIKFVINLKAGKLKDAKGLARDISKIGHRGMGDYHIQVYDDKNIEYIKSLFKQVVSP